MTMVRDHTYTQSDYDGRLTDARDDQCPCRPCFHPHDWKTPIPVYRNGMHTSNRYPLDMRCATRENRGCPSPLPKPIHIYGKNAGCCCKRCRASVKPNESATGPTTAK